MEPSEVTSDCQGSATLPSLFDGNPKSWFETCSGLGTSAPSRIGRGLYLNLTDAAAITKVCFTQYQHPEGWARNYVIPGWDVEYSTDGGSTWTLAFEALLTNDGVGGPNCAELAQPPYSTKWRLLISKESPKMCASQP